MADAGGGGDTIQSRYNLDATGFKRGVDEILTATRKIESEELRVARATEDFELASARRKVQAADLAARGKIEASEKVERAQLDAIRKQERVLEDSERRKAQAVDNFQRRQERATEQAGRERVQEIARNARRELDIIERTERAKVRAAQQADRDRMRAATRADDKRHKEGFGGFADSMAGQFTIASGLMSAWGGIVGFAHAYSGIIAETNDRQKEMVDNLLRTKEEIRGLGTMLGEKGASKEFTAKFKQFQAETGFDSDTAAKDFLTEYHSTGGTGVAAGNISKEEFDRGEEVLGRLVKSQGGGEQAAGAFATLIGLLMRTRKYETAEHAGAEAMDVIDVLQQGRGEDPTLVKEMASQYGGLVSQGKGGLIKDPRELAALTAAAAMKNPKEASTVLNQSFRMLVGGTEESEAFIDKMGIKPGMGLGERFEKFFQNVEEAEKRGEMPMEYLKDQGVPGESLPGIGVMYQERGFIREKRRAMLAGEGVSGPDEFNKTIKGRFDADDDLQMDLIKAAQGQAEATQAGKHVEYEKGLAEAIKRRTDRGERTSEAGGIRDWMFGMLAGGQDAKTGQDIQDRIEMQKMLKEKTGRDVGPQYDGMGHSLLQPLADLATAWSIRGEDFKAEAGAAYESSGGVKIPGISGGGGKEPTVAVAQLSEAQKQTILLQQIAESAVGGGGLPGMVNRGGGRVR